MWKELILVKGAIFLTRDNERPNQATLPIFESRSLAVSVRLRGIEARLCTARGGLDCSSHNTRLFVTMGTP